MTDLGNFLRSGQCAGAVRNRDVFCLRADYIQSLAYRVGARFAAFRDLCQLIECVLFFPFGKNRYEFLFCDHNDLMNAVTLLIRKQGIQSDRQSVQVQKQLWCIAAHAQGITCGGNDC
ncbi:unknown [Clostridium sp. CAG:448]|nr:unknown [Clostridium sp. CAG:448]